MNGSTSLPLWCAAAALAAACGSADPGRARDALMETDRAFAAATARDRLEGWVRFFAPDGAMLQAGSLARGPAGVRERMATAFADTSFSLAWEPTEADVAASGDLGYTVGRWESRGRGPDGAARVTTGTYVTVWKRQPDGSWKVVLDTGSSDE